MRTDKPFITIGEDEQTFIFDSRMYEKALRKAAGTLSSKNHPEWKTRSQVSQWLRQTRLSDERAFEADI